MVRIAICDDNKEAGLLIKEKVEKYCQANNIKFRLDVFELDTFRYIPKNQLDMRLEKALIDAVKKLNAERSQHYIIENKRGIEKIPICQIVSVWREGKNSVIMKENGTESKVRKTLYQVYEELPAGEFEWINRGTICNLAQAVKVDGEELVLKNGMSDCSWKDT